MTKKSERRNRPAFGRSQSAPSYKPRPPRAAAAAVWARIDYLVAQEKPKEEPLKKDGKARKRRESRRKASRRRFLRLLDLVGTVVWVAVLLKLFVADVDRLMLAWVAPQLLWVVDLRWLLVLVGAALMLVLLRARTLGVSLAYIVAFPLIVILWKLPKFFVKRRDTILITSMLGVIASLLGRARSLIVAGAIACIAAVLITSTGTPAAIVAAGMILIALVLLWSLGSTAVDLLSATAVIRAQQKAADWLLRSDLIERVISPEQPDQVELKTWTLEEAKKYRDAGGNALLVRRGILFWAAALEQYRRGPGVVVLSCLILVAMIVQTIAVFSFVNYGAFVLAPDDFQFSRQPDAWTFIYYSSVGVYFGEISALSPSGGVALMVKFANGIIGSVGVLLILATTLLGHHASQTNEATNSASRSLRMKADRVENLAEEQFQMPLDDLLNRLSLAGWGLVGVLSWIAEKTPGAGEPVVTVADDA